MSFYSVDIEMDGPIAGDYSIVSIGVVLIEPSLSKTFYAEIKPISEKWVPEALAVSGFTREQTLKFEEPIEVLKRLKTFVQTTSTGQPVFIADNPGFDSGAVNWYFHHFLGENPFGWSSRRIGDLYCGMQKDAYAKWKHLRKTKHEHNALGDALGNAEAVLEMQKLGLKIKLK